MSKRPLRAIGVAGAATLAVAGLVTAPAQAAPAPSSAPGGPGVLSRFDEGRKDCVGTARNGTSKVWFTVADGVLSDVYEPTIDNTNVESLQYVVTDGRKFTDLQQRDTTYTVRADASGMQCTVTSTSAAHDYQIVTTYLTDPARDTVLMHTQLRSTRTVDNRHLSLYARLDAHVNGNGGGGPANGGADTGTVDRIGVPVIGDAGTVSQATNRDYAVPTYMALDATALHGASVGYAGTESDALTALDATHALGTTYDSAPDGHIVATADVTPTNGDVTLALGFGRTDASAERTAQLSLLDGFGAVQQDYAGGWQAYDAALNAAPANLKAADVAGYYLSANVLKASEDKTFPGAIAASLASPWGQAVSAGDLVNGKPVYFGSYREVFSRDLYEAATGLLADGDVATAQAATRFVLERQQLPSGEIPRNSLLNGEVAPDTGGDQLDETAYPILLTYLTGLSSDANLYRDHIVPAADYLVAHGPSFGVERWEEQSGYSPSTIAAEIAGLTAAATIAKTQGDSPRARLYQAAADDFQRNVKAETVTTTGPLAPRYFIRLSKNGDPNSAITYNLGNGSIDVDQRQVVDGGFQDLVRLGELPATDPDVQASLGVLDRSISATTPTGTGYYRYGIAAPGSEDGYGDCYVPDPTNCPVNGQPWPTTDTGSGHLWPVLSGERAESALATGNTSLARSQLNFMLDSASGVGLVPEQVWEDPNVPADPYGTDPTTASIGFVDGKPAGSAAPLTWAQAQEVRLMTDIGAHAITDRPDITYTRYVRNGPPGTVPVSIATPSTGAVVQGSVQVTGTTAPGARVDVMSTSTDIPGATTVKTTVAGSDGAYAVTVPAPTGTDVIAVAAKTATGTGFARVTVTGDITGTTVLDAADPTGDDNGPGTYQYPTSGDFTPGSFDITRFQVITNSDTVYLRFTLRTLTDTFGNAIGAQLFDVYVHQPGAASTSQAAAFPQRNYTIAPADAWSQRVEVQGFAAPVWVDPSGNGVGSVTAVGVSDVAKTVTIALPKAQFGTPGAGWSFTVTLTGQDGFSPDQARSFAPTPQPFQFGVCAPGGTSPICGVDPNSVPKVMDTIPRPGVSQAIELDPTLGPVVLTGVPVGG